MMYIIVAVTSFVASILYANVCVIICDTCVLNISYSGMLMCVVKHCVLIYNLPKEMKDYEYILHFD